MGYYGDRGDEALTEASPPGSGFLADVCVAWEEEARAAAALGVRTVSLRIGIVLAREGGALAMLARLFRLGLGGVVGSGRQWVPWIHVDDLVAMIRTALRDERWSGAANAVAPEPATNADLTRELARAVHRPALLPAPAFAVRAVARRDGRRAARQPPRDSRARAAAGLPLLRGDARARARSGAAFQFMIPRERGRALAEHGSWGLLPTPATTREARESADALSPNTGHGASCRRQRQRVKPA